MKDPELIKLGVHRVESTLSQYPTFAVVDAYDIPTATCSTLEMTM